MPNKQEAELEVLVRARYPLIYLVSWEETRVQAMLERLGAKQSKKVFTWTVTQGICDSAKARDSSVKEPQAVLDYVAKSGQPGLFVLKDFHSFMKDPRIVRALRDLVQDLKTSYKTLILLSPVLEIPVELEKDVTVVDYDLPGADELLALFQDVIASAKAGGRFQVDVKAGEGEKLIHAALGMTLSEAENAIARAIVQDSRLDAGDVDVILEEKKQIIRKSRLLEYFEAREEFGQIGGLELLKDWLGKRGQAFSEKARQFGLPQPKGLLLLGVQGCGKSLTCKAISGLWKLPLLRLDMGSIFGGLVGQSEENMRRAIKTAESVAPCILWLDEIEKGLAGTQSSGNSDAGTTARVFSTFLTWLQEKTKPVFVAATANNIEQLPPELLRKGRLDEIFFVDLPNLAERREIFKIHLARKKRDPAKFDLDVLGKAAAGYSGAEIEQVVVSALYDAFSLQREVSQADLEASARALVPLSVTMKEGIARLREWASSRARPASPADRAP